MRAPLAIHRLTQPILAVAAIALAAAAQYAHTFQQANLIALGLYLLAFFCWVFAILLNRVDLPTRVAETIETAPHRRKPFKALMTSSLILAVLTFLFSSGNEFNPDNLLAWSLSIAVFLYTFWEPEKTWHAWREWLECLPERVQEFLTNGIRLAPPVVMLSGVMLVGIFFYYHDLDGVPAEMTSDHAEKLLDVNDIVNNGLRPIFFERNTGREPIQFYLTAIFVEWTEHPIDHMALKLITAGLGVLVILFTFLFVRELFDDDVALLAALFVAFSKWPVTIARMGLRFPLTPVFIAPLMYFLFRALKYRRRNDFLMTGLVLGIGLNGYNAFRVAPLLVAAFLALWFIFNLRRFDGAQFRYYLANILLLFALMVVAMMPLLRYMTEHPNNFWYRIATRLTNVEQPVPANPVGVLARNVVNASLMFNWTGDEAWPNSIPNDPVLEYVTGALFLLGFVYAIYRLGRYRETAYLYLLVGLGIMLLPSILSLAFPNENPSVVRAGGAIPFVFTIVALPLAWLARAFKQSMVDPTVRRVIVTAVMALIVFISIVNNYLRYFVDFNESYRKLSWNSSEVAAAIRSYEGVVDLDHTWILLYPHWIDTRNVAINLHSIGWEQTLPSGNDANAQVVDPSAKLYVLNMNDSTNLNELRQIFPAGQMRVFHSPTPGHDFLLFYVPSK